MSRNLKVSGVLVAIFAVAVVVVVLLGGGDEDTTRPASTATAPAPAATQSPAARAVRAGSRRLGVRGRSGVTFTEFLDFECEACRAAFPIIEQLRREYAGRVTFAMRYFPVPSHRNAQNAAVAVEAAAQQGRLEAMYKRMFETQSEWGEQTTSKAGTFRGFAQDLGLDMRAFDAAVSDPGTLARVEADRAEGVALGVQGTPSFFLGEEQIEPESLEDLRSRLNAALRSA